MVGQYEEFLRHIRTNGAFKSDRTGTGTYSVFGYQMRFDLQEGFPLVTTKKLHTKSIVGELLWMLRGDTNVKWLQDNGITIWNEWADVHGDLGPVYGAQWRDWDEENRYEAIDQLADVIHQIRTNPDSRRLIVTAWNPSDLPKQALPPCHMMFQFYVLDGKLSCHLYQRSADAFLGVPYNIASYALLTHLIAVHVGLDVGEFIWTGGDCHIYANHLEQVDEQLSRSIPPFPTLEGIVGRYSFDQHEIEDFYIVDYNPHPSIKAPVAV